MRKIIFKLKQGILRDNLFCLLIWGLIICFMVIANLLSVSNTLYGGSEMTQWAKLFNGNDLNGWIVFGGGKWEVINGEIVGKFNPSNENRGWLVYPEEYEDFNLRLKYKITKGRDSGVCLRVPTDKIQTAESSGYEIEILNDRTVLNTSGAIYNIRRTYFGIEKDGQWNEFLVYAYEDHLICYINGMKASEFYMGPGRSFRGSVGMQTMAGGAREAFTEGIPEGFIEFKDIEIKEIGRLE